MNRRPRIARENASHFSRGSVEEEHRLAAEPADEKRLDAPGFGLVEYGPEADMTGLVPHTAANKR